MPVVPLPCGGDAAEAAFALKGCAWFDALIGCFHDGDDFSAFVHAKGRSHDQSLSKAYFIVAYEAFGTWSDVLEEDITSPVAKHPVAIFLFPVPIVRLIRFF